MSHGSGLDSLVDYPVDFPIKVMGRRTAEFVPTVIMIVQRHAPDWDPQTLETRPSKQGAYVSVTATIRATSRAQLDALYIELSGHPAVSVVL